MVLISYTLGVINIARPVKYTADQLDKAIEQYFADHNTPDNAPKWHDMLNYLSVSDDTLLRYRSNTDDKYNGYAEVIKKAERLHSCFWQQLAIDKPNIQTYCIFQLKQPHNGGLTDKQEVSQDVKVNLQIGGMNAKLAE